MLPLIDFVIVGHNFLDNLIASTIAIVATSIAVAVAIAVAIAETVAAALVGGRGCGRSRIVRHILIGIWYLIVGIDVQRGDDARNCLCCHFAQFLRLEGVLCTFSW